MNSEDYNHFVVIVAGDDPDIQMMNYDSQKEVEPYVVYKYCDAPKIKDSYLRMYDGLINNPDLSEDEKKELQEEYNEIKDESPVEVFYEVTEGYDYDNATGDAISTKNPNGRWRSYNLGKFFSVPFLTNDGKEIYQAKKGDVKWESMHLNGREIYQRAWEMVIDGSTPQNDTEKLIYENMKNRTTYFLKFGTKENYVASSTAFWGYAFLSKKTGWVQLEDNENQFEWVTSYYDRFIKPLSKNTLLTIYECTR